MSFLGPLSFGLADEIEEKAEGDQGNQTVHRQSEWQF
jgi:hypothetical protein